MAQRRHVDANHRKSAEQIVAHAPFLHRVVECGIDARDRTHVERDRLVAVDEDRFAVAQHAGQPRLHARRRIGHVLQVERAAGRLVETAAAADTLETVRQLIGMIRARRHTEDEHVEVGGIDGRAVDGDEGADGAAILHRVNRARHDLPARALLAADQHASAHRGRTRDEPHHISHRG